MWTWNLNMSFPHLRYSFSMIVDRVTKKELGWKQIMINGFQNEEI